ncbi:hypothetical protein [Micromonospora sp. NBC_01796]|uniref:hypothetical protein n=1 Tax=Micromonospora sp. NBC_01796 TaxID=2975987 RepID=UPI002DDACBB8|nr:hypothetical protein [Micromonospora sp. NBC_01796]WSA86767.1 hypothetical protein OIE47_03840 [Micromonospora sp. NBC_01796]
MAATARYRSQSTRHRTTGNKRPTGPRRPAKVAILPAVTFTSPVPPLDLRSLFPGIEAFGRTATRLHPRAGTPGLSDSHVAGMLLWPADEPWPTCRGPHLVPTETSVPAEVAALLKTPRVEMTALLRERIPGFTGIRTTEAGTVLLGSEAVTEPIPSPLVPVAQLRAADIPDLHCPVGTDLLQVLWCPNRHHDSAGPPVQLRWRVSSTVVDPLPAPPPPTVVRAEQYLLRSCVLHPEQVTEYPWWQELPAELGRRVRDFDDNCQLGEHDYSSVSRARGWKVGGYATWALTDLLPMDCPGCHRSMDLLLTVDSSESEGSSAWLPVEDSHLRPSRTDPEWMAAYQPTGVSVGREGRLQVFVCMTCPDTPTRQIIQ